MSCGHTLESSLSCKSCGWDAGKLAEFLREISTAAVLQFSNVRPPNAAQLREILAVLSFPDSITRLNEVRVYVDFIKASPLESWERSISFEFFDYAVQAYLFGFDHAAIYYGALATELALATSLGEISPYRKLIKRAKDKLGIKLIQNAVDLNFLRDCYVHYQNLYLFSQVQNAEIVEAIRSLKGTGDEVKERILRDAQILTESSRRRFPVSAGRSRYLRRYKEFLRGRSKEYLEWFRRRGFGAIDLVGDIEEHGASRWYDRRGYDALDAIKKSYEILSELGAFASVNVTPS
jgi:hypothetical protein